MPLWNPHVMAGRPFVANSQSALFSPFTWPSLILPFWWSLGIAAALKLFCAAFGAHLLARALGIRWTGALLAGLVYAFGLYYVVWLSWPLSSVWAWLPWLLLCVHHVVHRRGAAPVVALAVVVALQYFGGHPESSFHVLAAGSLFALLALSRVPGEERLRAIGRLAAGLVAGTLLAAIALLPFLELLAHSGDLENREGKVAGHLSFGALVTYVLPDYWGRPSGAQTEGFSVVRAFYAGALPLMLGIWAIVARRTRERVAIAGGGLLAIAIVVGFPGHLPGRHRHPRLQPRLQPAADRGRAARARAAGRLGARRPAGRRPPARGCCSAARWPSSWCRSICGAGPRRRRRRSATR